MAECQAGRKIEAELIKITMIGAGSMVFSRNLTGDILSYPEFHNACICYMDIDPDRLAATEMWGRRVAAGVGAQPRFEATTDLEAALSGADVVIIMFQVGGLGATLLDFEIPRQYGLNFTIADTTGPGGLFRALRTYPALVRLCRGIRAHCPRALVINYSNPMSMNMAVLREEGIATAVGLCHSVQGTADRLTWYLGVKPGELEFECAGINHMAGFLKLEHRGKNLYPQLFQCAENAEIVKHDRVRFDLLRRLGFFMTESSEHHAEYNPWYIPHGRESIGRLEVPIDEYLRRCDESEKEFAALFAAAGDLTPIRHTPSPEYGARVIYGYFCGKPHIVYGNMPNRGAIGNLPPHAIVETPTCVGGGVLRLTALGDLPLSILGYVQPHVLQHDLFMEAVKTGRRECIYQACMFDPLTAGVLTPDVIVTMCDELIAAHGEEIPRLTRQFPHASMPASDPVPSAAELLAARRGHKDG
ncbi:MAG: alpha-glucosidase/alpha-galactosidase [Phycisphaerae bacterium]